MSNVLTNITMEEYIAKNIDDVGVTSRNTHIRHHTITERRTVNIPDKYKNSNLGTSVSESNIRVDHRKYTENNCCLILITTNICISGITPVTRCYNVWTDVLDTKGSAPEIAKEILTHSDLMNDYDTETNTAKVPLTGKRKIGEIEREVCKISKFHRPV
jgi:hypothetical protein